MSIVLCLGKLLKPISDYVTLADTLTARSLGFNSVSLPLDTLKCDACGFFTSQRHQQIDTVNYVIKLVMRS